MRASAPTYDSSSATASGACSAMSPATASWIVFKRRTVSWPAGVDQQPCATSLRRPPLSWTIPYPQAAVPGSMPTTFTAESYGPDRTNPVRAVTQRVVPVAGALGLTDDGCRSPTYGLTSDRRHLSIRPREHSCRSPSQTAAMPPWSTPSRGGQRGDPDGTGPLRQSGHGDHLVALRSLRKARHEHRRQCSEAPSRFGDPARVGVTRGPSRDSETAEKRYADINGVDESEHFPEMWR
jgi:hypothetical protein